MKFRFVWLPDDDPEGNSGNSAAVPECSVDETVYQERRGGIVRQTGDGRNIPVANFTTRITSDVVLDDGEEQQRYFRLEAELGGHKSSFVLPAAEFARMAWVLRKLGPKAIVYPGQQQHARAAIQSFSMEIEQKRIYTHLGWMKWGSDWIYLHAAGAIGATARAAGRQLAHARSRNAVTFSAGCWSPICSGSRAQEYWPPNVPKGPSAAHPAVPAEALDRSGSIRASTMH